MKRRIQLAAILGALLLGVVPGLVSAATSCVSGTLQPGQEACTGTVYAPNSAEATGSGNLKTLRFKIYWSASASGPFTVDVDDQDDFEAVSFTKIWPEGDAAKIPGYFFVCARRPTRFANAADYEICITGE